MTLTVSRCVTHPTVQKIGQLVELSRSVNRPTRFGQRLKRELKHVKTTFGEQTWLDVLGKIRAEYNGPIAQHRLFQPRDDGFAERQRLRDLAKIEAAAVAYVTEVDRDLTAQ